MRDLSDEFTDLDEELNRLYYLGEHRGTYNRALDKAKSHGTPYVPRHAYGVDPGGDAA